MSQPLTEARFNALRFWAMNFAPNRRIKVGVATRPIFRYTREQWQRLNEIPRAVPMSTQFVWLAIFTILWIFLACLIGIVPLAPLIAGPLPPAGQIGGLLLEIAIGLNLLSAYLLGSIVATWVAGRIIASLLLTRRLEQDHGDASLLARIEQQAIRVAIFSLIAAALPTFLMLVIAPK